MPGSLQTHSVLPLLRFLHAHVRVEIDAYADLTCQGSIRINVNDPCRKTILGCWLPAHFFGNFDEYLHNLAHVWRNVRRKVGSQHGDIYCLVPLEGGRIQDRLHILGVQSDSSQVAAMRAAQLIAVVGVSLFLVPLSYAQHGGGHMGGGFSGRGTFSSGHSSGRGRSSHSSSRFVSGLRHIVPIPRFWKSPKSATPATDLRVGRSDPPRRPIIGIRPSAPLFLRRPTFGNPCLGHAFCAGFGFGSPLLCDPFFGFGNCFPFFGPGLGFQGNFLSTGAEPEDETSVASDAADLNSTPAMSSRDGADHPITLLQLKSGWMYGLADYWVEGNNLHYVTNYGGKNSVPLELIDLPTTIRLNSERGVEFSLHTKGQSTEQ